MLGNGKVVCTGMALFHLRADIGRFHGFGTSWAAEPRSDVTTSLGVRP